MRELGCRIRRIWAKALEFEHGILCNVFGELGAKFTHARPAWGHTIQQDELQRFTLPCVDLSL